MSIAVEPCRGNESAFPPEMQSQQGSAGSSIQLPNVFITPPEEEFDTPAWCCFDADKDAQLGAFAFDDLQNQDFDYAAYAEEEIFGRDVEGHVLADNMSGNREREDVFVMHSSPLSSTVIGFLSFTLTFTHSTEYTSAAN